MYAEDAAGEFSLQIMLMAFVMFLMAITIFFVSYIQSSDFKTYIDGQIERNGGLTATSVQNIQEYSNKFYDGKFEVTSLSGSEKQAYGLEVEYIVTGNVEVFFFDLPDQLVTSRGSAISMVK
ncbi:MULTISPECIES: hypothetical protein [Niallia]|uniref:hypothetical protein n=1 Tax=Niallia TaxID=2837506 RepID=UPI001EDB40A8|nr:MULTISPECIES: hypothetical protein [Niallia]MED4041028.1 hypothetical protein [Niallia taxi]UPO90956.1 hypothetical protein L8T27_026835 [Niallia sp. Man26]